MCFRAQFRRQTVTRSSCSCQRASGKVRSARDVRRSGSSSCRGLEKICLRPEAMRTLGLARPRWQRQAFVGHARPGARNPLDSATLIQAQSRGQTRQAAPQRYAPATHVRGVAQPGRAPGSGPGGRRFKSSLPDHKLLIRLDSFSRFSQIPHSKVQVLCPSCVHVRLTAAAIIRSRSGKRVSASEATCPSGLNKISAVSIAVECPV
jgi:hypothetical protein